MTDSFVTRVMQIVATQDNALVACVVVDKILELRVRLTTTVKVIGARSHLGNSAVLEGMLSLGLLVLSELNTVHRQPQIWPKNDTV